MVAGAAGHLSCYETSTCALFATFTTCSSAEPTSSGSPRLGGNYPPPSTVTSTSTTTVTTGGAGGGGGTATVTTTTTASATITAGGLGGTTTDSTTVTTTTTTTTTTTESSAATVTVSGPAPACDNVINDGFETGDLAGWSNIDLDEFSFLGLTTTEEGQALNSFVVDGLPTVYARDYSWSMATNMDVWYGLKQSVTLCAVTLQNGASVPLTLTTQVRSATGTGQCDVYFGLETQTGVLQTELQPSPGDAAWTLLSVSFTYDGTAQDAAMIFLAKRVPGQKAILFDNIQFQ